MTQLGVICLPTREYPPVVPMRKFLSYLRPLWFVLLHNGWRLRVQGTNESDPESIVWSKVWMGKLSFMGQFKQQCIYRGHPYPFAIFVHVADKGPSSSILWLE